MGYEHRVVWEVDVEAAVLLQAGIAFHHHLIFPALVAEVELEVAHHSAVMQIFAVTTDPAWR